MTTQTIALSPDSSQDYIDRLEAMLAEAERNLTQTSRRESGYQKNYDDAKKWKEALHTYLTNIVTTFELARNAKDLLNSMKVNATCVGQNLDWTVISIEKLVQFVKEAAEETDQLRAMKKHLMDQIACLNSPVLTTNPPGNSLMNLLKDLQQKTSEALVYWLNAITKVLDVLKIADKLKLSIVGVPKTKNTEAINGIIMDLNEMINLLKDGTKSYWKPLEWTFPDSDCGAPPAEGPECSIPIPCLMIDQVVVTDPALLSSLSTNPGKKEDGSCKNKYFLRLREKHSNAIEWENYWKALLEEARQKKNDALSQRNAINKGLVAAKAAKVSLRS
ncbi:MAG: hypothetical protein DHS20C18_34700 [Saprospiraceae bacterium]|nr:MAG: hypothetical protein DHS20C18_34700 [Saprospiraceae bacterium]